MKHLIVKRFLSIERVVFRRHQLRPPIRIYQHICDFFREPDEHNEGREGRHDATTMENLVKSIPDRKIIGPPYFCVFHVVLQNCTKKYKNKIKYINV